MMKKSYSSYKTLSLLAVTLFLSLSVLGEEGKACADTPASCVVFAYPGNKQDPTYYTPSLGTIPFEYSWGAACCRPMNIDKLLQKCRDANEDYDSWCADYPDYCDVWPDVGHGGINPACGPVVSKEKEKKKENSKIQKKK